ncbi:MAG: PorP/SprF family type IX secretion system membrane protein [Bacteroidota bacterium]
MHRLRLLFLTLSFTVLCATIGQAQDPVFSQFFSMPMQLNPAFAGNTAAPRLAFSYRDQWQWAAPLNVYKTYAVSYGQFFDPINSSLGIMIQADDAGEGVYRNNSFSGIYGYRLQINRELFVKVGVEAAIMQSNLDWNKLVFLDQIDPIDGVVKGSEESANGRLSQVSGSVGAGMLLYAKNYYIGFGAKHLNTPDESFLDVNSNLASGLPMRIALQAGGQFTLQKGSSRQTASFISPNATLVRQGNLMQVNAGAYLGYGAFFGGAWFRHAIGNPDAAIFMVGAEYDIFRIGYSYDFTVSGLSASQGGSGGTSEITVILNFENSANFKRQRRSNRYNDCLKMFR